MPIFEYMPDKEGCEECSEGLEVIQKMDDPPLEKCPDCGQPCHRVFSSFAVGGKGSSLLSPSNLAEKGFTQYTRKGKGYYEKTAGEGPQGIAAES